MHLYHKFRNKPTFGYELKMGMVMVWKTLVFAFNGHTTPLEHASFSLLGSGNGILTPAIVPNSWFVNDLNPTFVVKLSWSVMFEFLTKMQGSVLHADMSNKLTFISGLEPKNEIIFSTLWMMAEFLSLFYTAIFVRNWICTWYLK